MGEIADYYRDLDMGISPQISERMSAAPPARKPFWIVFNPDYHAPPTVIFSTREAAETAAQTMSERYAPDHFYVCQAVSVANVQIKRTPRFRKL